MLTPEQNQIVDHILESRKVNPTHTGAASRIRRLLSAHPEGLPLKVIMEKACPTAGKLQEERIRSCNMNGLRKHVFTGVRARQSNGTYAPGGGNLFTWNIRDEMADIETKRIAREERKLKRLHEKIEKTAFWLRIK
jgi:hypothetical protein